jgi:glucosamine--fructose-6-phosphate aminotransferase (isomerizing)
MTDPFMQEILGQPSALRRAGAAVGDQFEELQALARARCAERSGERAEERPIVCTGMGSSLDACYPMVAALAERGVLASMIDTSELLHFMREVLGPDTLLLTASQSGETVEVVRLLERVALGERPFVASVTNGLDNTLARLADLALDTRAGPEEAPSTMTFAAALVVLGGVAGVLAGDDPGTVVPAIGFAAEEAAHAAEMILGDPEGEAERLRTWMGNRSTIELLGRGPGRAASEMGALTFKEAARIPAESLGTADFRHGPLEIAGPDLAAIVVTEPRTREFDMRMVQDLLRTGSAVLVVGDEAEPIPEGAERFDLPPIDPMVRPALAVIPAQLLAWKLALEGGFRPGEFRHASKTTTRE